MKNMHINDIRYFVVFVLALLFCNSNVCAQFNPDNPAEPNVYSKVTISTYPSNIGFCYGDGTYLDGTTINISTSCYNSNYVFDHWTLNGVVYNAAKSEDFSYKVTNKDAAFVAHYKYAPQNPSEPSIVLTRKLNFVSKPAGVASFNWTNGSRIEVGSNAYICAYPKSGYAFKGWYKDNKLISSDMNFEYIMPNEDVTLTAFFEFDPTSPSDPTTLYTCIINAVSSDDSKGSVSISGLLDGRAVFGTYITVSVSLADNCNFAGWSDGTSIVSTDLEYRFIAKKPLTLTALFKDGLDAGDVNGDSKVTIKDLVNLINVLKSSDNKMLKSADVDNNGEVNLSDVSALVKILIGKK